jgi:hypothetical protein
MRLLMINLLATCALLVSAATAGAFSASVVATTPTVGNVGDIVSFDVFLDTEGDLALNLFSISLTFDPSVAAYRSDLSATNGYYPIYTPGSGKAPGSWLNPSPFDGVYCTAGDPICATPPGEWVGNLPPIGGQVNIDFISSTFPTGLSGAVDTLGSGTTVAQLARVSFELIGPGTSAGVFGFGNGGNVVGLTGGTDVTDQVAVSGDVTMSVIPEPTTALLVGLGLVGLGVAGRRRA